MGEAMGMVMLWPLVPFKLHAEITFNLPGSEWLYWKGVLPVVFVDGELLSLMIKDHKNKRKVVSFSLTTVIIAKKTSVTAVWCFPKCFCLENGGVLQ